ncbi:MAG: hypothetical protein K0Q49_713 [Haloplasmataceae bacterium]|jgi:uncharacterized membrane protein YwzB|nr:hypothetical protein [Haloplasmataceae bacterium]
MIDKFVIVLKIGTYLAIMPFVFRIIMGIDLSRIFKKNHTAEIKMAYLFLTIIISKLIGDFIIDIMDLIRILLDLSNI